MTAKVEFTSPITFDLLVVQSFPGTLFCVGTLVLSEEDENGITAEPVCENWIMFETAEGFMQVPEGKVLMLIEDTTEKVLRLIKETLKGRVVGRIPK